MFGLEIWMFNREFDKQDHRTFGYLVLVAATSFSFVEHEPSSIL